MKRYVKTFESFFEGDSGKIELSLSSNHLAKEWDTTEEGTLVRADSCEVESLKSDLDRQIEFYKEIMLDENEYDPRLDTIEVVIVDECHVLIKNANVDFQG